MWYYKAPYYANSCSARKMLTANVAVHCQHYDFTVWPLIFFSSSFPRHTNRFTAIDTFLKGAFGIWFSKKKLRSMRETKTKKHKVVHQTSIDRSFWSLLNWIFRFYLQIKKWNHTIELNWWKQLNVSWAKSIRVKQSSVPSRAEKSKCCMRWMLLVFHFPFSIIDSIWWCKGIR